MIVGGGGFFEENDLVLSGSQIVGLVPRENSVFLQHLRLLFAFSRKQCLILSVSDCCICPPPQDTSLFISGNQR